MWALLWLATVLGAFVIGYDEGVLKEKERELYRGFSHRTGSKPGVPLATGNSLTEVNAEAAKQDVPKP
jgi:hypothetical protein